MNCGSINRLELYFNFLYTMIVRLVFNSFWLAHGVKTTHPLADDSKSNSVQTVSLI